MGPSASPLALVVVLSAQLMVVLDFSIVNVALPSIQRDLAFSATGLEWVVTAYAITFGGLLILGGRAGDLLGRRRLFLTGLVAFAAASLLGGFAGSGAMLVAARAWFSQSLWRPSCCPLRSSLGSCMRLLRSCVSASFVCAL